MTLSDEQAVRHIGGLIRASDRHGEQMTEVKAVVAIVHNRVKLLDERLEALEKELSLLTKKVQYQRNDINKLFIGHPNL